MHIPGLGATQHDGGADLFVSEPMPVRMLNGEIFQIVVIEDYEDDPHQEDFHAAIAAFLSKGPEVLTAAQDHIFDYYRDVKSRQDRSDQDVVVIGAPGDVWRHIRFGIEPQVERADPDERDVYITIACNCDWEREHGLQIVLRNGATVSRIGPYDGHPTHAGAYGDDSLKDVVYRRLA